MTDQAVADGLDDAPERLTPEVVDVDTSRAKSDDDEPVAPTEVVHLPVRQEPVADARMGSLIPLQEELRGVAELAVTLAMADVVPKALRGKPADVLAVILTGRELGVAPMTAIRAFHVIEGQVTIAPKMRLAMVRQQGLGKLWPDEANDDEQATWFATRTDQPGVRFQSTYTMAQARAAGLTNKSNWKAYPERMLSWRCLGFLLDDAFSEVGTAIYQPDELGAITDEDGEAILDVESTETLVPARGRTQSQKDPDPVANPATVERLRKRAEAVKAYPAAYEELKRLWAAEGLPKLDDLLHRHERDLSAILDDIERRIAKAEFGKSEAPKTTEPTPAPADGALFPDPAALYEPPPDATDSTPQEAVSAPEAQSAPDVPPEAQEATQGLGFDPTDLPTERTAKADLRWVAKAPVALVTECGEAVKAMSTADVLAALEAEDLPTTGNAATCGQRLAMRRIRIAMEAKVDEYLAEGSDG